jgi:hypothetical protein
MRSSIFLTLFFMVGCKHIGLVFEPSGTIKAVVQGVINGINVHCEKTIELNRKNWELMCKVSDDIDIKYRTQSIDKDQTKLEIIVDKTKGRGPKTLIAPILFVKGHKSSAVATANDKGQVDVFAEHVQ